MYIYQMEVPGVKTPENLLSLLRLSYKKVIPAVQQELARWEKLAKQIPDRELKKQALASIDSKRFHCEGGAIFSLLAGEKYEPIVSFIVSFQTICDYLDNLCDRSGSLDPNDFTALHEAMEDALNPETELRNYYRFRSNRDDGGYLRSLVKNCQKVLSDLENYKFIRPYVNRLCRYYCALQVHKHVRHKERVPRLQQWFERYQQHYPGLTWYEFSACCGSTLGIFCLVSVAVQPNFTCEEVESIFQGYFPYIQGLHILLDYLIDQQEDRQAGDLNFCTYYPDETTMLRRLKMFVHRAEQQIDSLPFPAFHRLIQRGLLGLYLSDDKVAEQPNVQKIRRELLKTGGHASLLFYLNGKLYRKWRQISNHVKKKSV